MQAIEKKSDQQKIKKMQVINTLTEIFKPYLLNGLNLKMTEENMLYFIKDENTEDIFVPILNEKERKIEFVPESTVNIMEVIQDLSDHFVHSEQSYENFKNSINNMII